MWTDKIRGSHPLQGEPNYRGWKSTQFFVVGEIGVGQSVCNGGRQCVYNIVKCKWSKNLIRKAKTPAMEMQRSRFQDR